jgi:hypothetical protein
MFDGKMIICQYLYAVYDYERIRKGSFILYIN